MNPTIQPYQFNIIKEQVAVLLNTYTSVNDATTVKTVQAYVPKNQWVISRRTPCCYDFVGQSDGSSFNTRTC